MKSNKSLILVLCALLGVGQIRASYEGPYSLIAYMNNRAVTLKSLILGSAATSLNHNIFDNGHGQIGGDIRVYGIHDMWVQVSGYERVHLVQNDVCLHPNLFTVLGSILSQNNMFVQRWACVKWCYPLSFDFNVVGDKLQIHSTVFKYRFLSLYRAFQEIPLIPLAGCGSSSEMMIIVSVNGRAVAVAPNKIVQVHSSSALSPLAVITRMLFL